MKEILTTNYGDRWHPITKYTPHHTAVVADAETIAYNFARYGNSSNYVIGNDGEIILCVPEEYRAYTSSNTENDSQAITVEVCNETGAPEWRVSDKALEALIDLGVDICKRRGLPGFEWTGDANGTLTIHKMFDATACPGPYLESKMPYIAEEITRRVKEGKEMIYKINLEELKTQGYTTVSIELGETGGDTVAPPTKAEASPVPKPSIKIGDVVTMAEGAPVYGKSQQYSSFIYKSKLYVRDLNGNRAVVSTQPSGEITGPVDIKYLTKV